MSDNNTWELNERHGQRAHDSLDKHFEETNRATINAGQAALRMAVLVNGGAAVSVLAFIGQLVGQGRVTVTQLTDVASSLMFFAFGVAVAGASMGFTYFTGYCQTASMARSTKKWQHPYVEPTRRSRAWSIAGSTFQVCAVVAGLAALLLFIYGMLDVRDSVARLGRAS